MPGILSCWGHRIQNTARGLRTPVSSRGKSCIRRRLSFCISAVSTGPTRLYRRIPASAEQRICMVNCLCPPRAFVAICPIHVCRTLPSTLTRIGVPGTGEEILAHSPSRPELAQSGLKQLRSGFNNILRHSGSWLSNSRDSCHIQPSGSANPLRPRQSTSAAHTPRPVTAE